MGKQNLKINWRYAIGEFLIVVIGIVAAFQLDSWKERRYNNDLITGYLTDLQVGLKNDSLYYGMATKYFDELSSEMDSTKKYIRGGSNEMKGARLNSIKGLADWYRVFVTNTAFEDLNNSGRLNLIQDKDIRYGLISYYQYIHQLKLLDNEYNESLNRMQEYLLKRLDFSTGSYLILNDEDAILVMNYLDKKQKYMDDYLSHRRRCQNINNTIRQRILTRLD
ncbi:MAG: hypothetical protein AAF039_18275 [Bacteroidota bacterium]